MRCGGVASQKLCTARSLVVCLCERRQTPGVNRNSCGLVKECFLRFFYSYSDRKRRSMSFFAPPQRFPSVLQTLASLLFARRRLAQLTAAT